MKEELLARIKSRGYWRINFQPLLIPKKLLPLGECKDTVERNIVELRGWNYPHFPRQNDKKQGLQPSDKFYEAWIDWGAHKEYWRIYQSSQFIHYLALREDWVLEDPFYNGDPRWHREPGTSLGITGTIYQITEIYEFVSRLGKTGLYDEGVRLTLSLCNTAQRSLWLNDPDRIPLSEEYKTGAEALLFEEGYPKETIILNSKESAFDIIVAIFDRFGWHRPNKEMIKIVQENLLRKII